MNLSTTAAQTDLIADALDESLEKEPTVATSSLPSLDKLVARVEQHTTRLRELEATLATQVEPSVLADVTRRIEDTERVATEAFGAESEAAAARDSG